MTYDREHYENVRRLIEVEQEQLQIAIEFVEDLGIDNSEKYPDHLKKKISNAVCLLKEIDTFYDRTLEKDYEDVKNLD